jgi:hypothetical protein
VLAPTDAGENAPVTVCADANIGSAIAAPARETLQKRQILEKKVVMAD